jgi:hypothetical protein
VTAVTNALIGRLAAADHVAMNSRSLMCIVSLSRWYSKRTLGNGFASGREYLKAEPDWVRPAALLALPECP